MSTACARPAGSSWTMNVDPHAEPRAVPDGLADLVAGLGGDDDPDLLDPGVGHRLDPVEEDGPVGDGDELLGAREGDRLQARALAAGEDEALHGGGR